MPIDPRLVSSLDSSARLADQVAQLERRVQNLETGTRQVVTVVPSVANVLSNTSNVVGQLVYRASDKTIWLQVAADPTSPSSWQNYARTSLTP